MTSGGVDVSVIEVSADEEASRLSREDTELLADFLFSEVFETFVSLSQAVKNSVTIRKKQLKYSYS